MALILTIDTHFISLCLSIINPVYNNFKTIIWPSVLTHASIRPRLVLYASVLFFYLESPILSKRSSNSILFLSISFSLWIFLTGSVCLRSSVYLIAYILIMVNALCVGRTVLSSLCRIQIKVYKIEHYLLYCWLWNEVSWRGTAI